MYDNQSKVLNMCVFYKYYDILCIFGYSFTYNINNDVDKPDHDKRIITTIMTLMHMWLASS